MTPLKLISFTNIIFFQWVIYYFCCNSFHLPLRNILLALRNRTYHLPSCLLKIFKTSKNKLSSPRQVKKFFFQRDTIGKLQMLSLTENCNLSINFFCMLICVIYRSSARGNLHKKTAKVNCDPKPALDQNTVNGIVCKWLI